MKKVALLIGMSEYLPGLNPLPGAVRDMEAMQRVLQHSDMGEFDQIQTLANPDVQRMQESIEALFSGCAKEDMTLLFFSGHGIKDDRGRLYFATSLTRKNANGDLVKSTAVPASFVQDIMTHARCKRQVVILDCCFSGAFAEGMTAKDDGVVDVQAQLGGEGRAVLTSSTSTQYSFEQQGAELSVYTRFIVEGIETGIADTDDDGFIAVDELHDYARKKVQATSPSMNPKIYAVEEGFRIFLAKAPVSDPRIIYRKEVERYASKGRISTIARNTLDVRRTQLELLPEVAAAIEAEVMKPFQEYQAKLQRYEQVLAAELQQRRVLRNTTLGELKAFQEALGLRKEDADAIAQRLMPSVPQSVQSLPQSLPPVVTQPVPQNPPEDALPVPKRTTATIQPLMSAPVENPVADRRPRSQKMLWIMGAVVGLAVVAGASARLFSDGNSTNVGSLTSIESPAIVEASPVIPEVSPEPSPIDALPSPDPIASPVAPAVWVVVVSSDKTLELAQEQVQKAVEAGLSAAIAKRNEWYAVQVGEEFASKAEAEKQRDYVLTVVPGWEKNKPFVRNQTDWCWQPVEQEGYVECQVKPSPSTSKE
jgi:Caspase domain/SPOR domain